MYEYGNLAMDGASLAVLWEFGVASTRAIFSSRLHVHAPCTMVVRDMHGHAQLEKAFCARDVVGSSLMSSLWLRRCTGQMKVDACKGPLAR
jgi:hypothetical protein